MLGGRETGIPGVCDAGGAGCWEAERLEYRETKMLGGREIGIPGNKDAGNQYILTPRGWRTTHVHADTVTDISTLFEDVNNSCTEKRRDKWGDE